MIMIINMLLFGLFIGYLCFYLQHNSLKNHDLCIKLHIKYIIIGFITNFFDFFGIGSYAPQTLFLKKDIDLLYLVPGTLTIANYLPIVIEAYIAITIINVDITTLMVLPIMASLGAYFSVKYIVIENTRLINYLLICALILSGILLLFNAFDIYPFNNIDTTLYGLQNFPKRLLLASVIYFILGAFQTFGLGIYAPGFAILGLLGVSYIAIVPINMLSSVLLSTSNSFNFIKKNKFQKSFVVIICISGILGVLFATYVATIVNLNYYINKLQILVAFIVFIVSLQMIKNLINKTDIKNY